MQIKDTGPVISQVTLDRNREELLRVARSGGSTPPELQSEQLGRVTELNKPKDIPSPGPATGAKPQDITLPNPVKMVDATRDNANLDSAEKAIGDALSYDRDSSDDTAKIADSLNVRLSPPVTKMVDGVKWQRLDFPSRNVFYLDLKEDIYVRPLSVATVNNIYKSIERQSPALYFDALNEHISIDIRDLTYPDFVYFCYWLRIESFPKTPYTFNWVSRYGNTNTVVMQTLPFKVHELQMTREEYLEYRALGIVMPSLREAEVLSNMNEEDEGDRENRWAVNYAQYVDKGDHPLDQNLMRYKLDRLLSNPDASFIETIQEFSDKVTHGIDEVLVLRDQHFTIGKAISYLEGMVETMTELIGAELHSNGGAPTTETLAMADRLEYYSAELKELITARDNGEEYTPKEEEVVTRELRNVDMFPTKNTA